MRPAAQTQVGPGPVPQRGRLLSVYQAGRWAAVAMARVPMAGGQRACALQNQSQEPLLPRQAGHGRTWAESRVQSKVTASDADLAELRVNIHPRSKVALPTGRNQALKMKAAESAGNREITQPLIR